MFETRTRRANGVCDAPYGAIVINNARKGRSSEEALRVIATEPGGSASKAFSKVSFLEKILVTVSTVAGKKVN